MNITNIDIKELIPYDKNPRRNDKAVEYVANSIKRFGFKVPLVIDKNKVIICGHTRYKACKELGMQEIPCIIADDLTEEQIKAYRLADNKVSEKAEWDFELLEGEINDILNINMTDFGFDFKFEVEKEIEEDDFEVKVPEEPKAKLGDIYQLGKHRLMCGDSTKEGDVKRLVGEQKIDLLITDPPYNVDYTGKTKESLKIENDKMENNAFHDFLVKAFKNAYNVLKDGGHFTAGMLVKKLSISIRLLKNAVLRLNKN